MSSPAVAFARQVFSPAESAATRVEPRAAEVWLLLGADLDQDFVSEQLGAAFQGAFGARCAVVRTGDLLPGVHDGRLTLHDLQWRPVPVPRVVYARLSTPRLSTDREVTLLRQLQTMGATLLNPIDAVLSCVNKFWHLQQLATAGIPVPDTYTYTVGGLAQAVTAGLPEPCVVKPIRGHRGRGVFLAPDVASLRELCDTDVGPHIFQDYVAHSHGRDLRVVVVDGTAVAAQVRTSADGSLTSNISRGGTSSLCTGTYPLGEELAVRAAEALGLTVAGVDLLFQADGTFTVCEVNANVAWRSHMPSVAPAIVEACAKRLTVELPAVQRH
ncbi:RimK family alpha-L-glutamate ligase [Streptacidiphilus rugosus]|uniref:RimK family alpha-L-glutamate ligase n=1 Tax=Streptacidiphilus rugosus TaxID=405783 RepID=UPI00068CDB93|nr:RimK family alpha-L-glutamate ligase [Streptacidiphilus rugosus]